MQRIGFAIMAALLITSAAHADIKKAQAALEAEITIPELQIQMDKGDFNAQELLKASLNRIQKYDKVGPAINAIIALNPEAEKMAIAADAQRKSGNKSPMLGIPILVKDNIDTKDNMPTTAGSLALKDNFTHRDSPSIAKLREEGVVIIGKTNLSEWANMRGDNSISGWSGLGGQTKNPYDTRRTPCGSSSGTGAGIAASFAVIGIGSETDGSIICPSNMMGLVGFKPTVGLVSRTHVIPISSTQDTLGPIGRNVEDIAIMLSIMAGTDPQDGATLEADKFKGDYLSKISNATLKGVKLGILKDNIGKQPKTIKAFEATLEKLKAAGAEVAEIPSNRMSTISENEYNVLIYELKAGLNKYLESAPENIKTRTLADMIEFNKMNAQKELSLFGQEDFEKSNATKGLDELEYIHSLNRSHLMAKANLNSLFETYKVDVLIAPSYGPAWFIDDINGDVYSGISSSGMAAMAGFPHLTVPMDNIQGLPVGLSFIGREWDDAKVLYIGRAFEKLGRMRIKPKL